LPTRPSWQQLGNSDQGEGARVTYTISLLQKTQHGQWTSTKSPSNTNFYNSSSDIRWHEA